MLRTTDVLFLVLALVVGSPSLLLEGQASANGPLGTGGVALALDADRWTLGAGVGLSDADPGNTFTHLAAFARLRVAELGRLRLALTATGSQADRDVVEEKGVAYEPGGESRRLEWRPGYRVDAGLALRWPWGRARFGLEAGVGYVLGQPLCTYQTATTFVYQESCDDPQIPEARRPVTASNRLAPFVAASIGFRLEDDEAHASEPAVPPSARDDALAPSVFFAPTALTQPAGTWTFTTHDLVLFEAAYAFTDWLQLGVGAGDIWPIGAPLVEANLRARIVTWGRLRGALVGAYFDSWGPYGTEQLLAGAGPIVSVCLDELCGSVVSASALGGWAHHDPDEGPTTTDFGVLVSPSAVVAVAPHLKLVAELHVVPGFAKTRTWLAGVRVPVGRITLQLGSVVSGTDPLLLASVAFRP